MVALKQNSCLLVRLLLIVHSITHFDATLMQDFNGDSVTRPRASGTTLTWYINYSIDQYRRFLQYYKRSRDREYTFSKPSPQ